MTWHRITSDQPATGAQVEIWHPAWGFMIVLRVDTGFREAGVDEDVIGPLVWWRELGERPPGEPEPSHERWLEAMRRAERAPQQIGFAEASKKNRK